MDHNTKQATFAFLFIVNKNKTRGATRGHKVKLYKRGGCTLTLILIDFIFWPPEIIDIWRSRPPGSSEVKQGLRMESEHQKTHDLITHITHFHWFHILTFLEIVIEGRSNWRSDKCVNISTYDVWVSKKKWKHAWLA